MSESHYLASDVEQYYRAQLRAVERERDELKHDIERHMDIANRLAAEKATLREALQSAPAALIEAFECGASRAHNDAVEGRYSDDPDVAREWLDEVRFDPHSNAYTILAALAVAQEK